MRKYLLLLMLLCSTWAMAQDVIVKTDGTSILCRVVEVNSSEVVYKKWSDLKGSNYVMNRKDVSTINYESGKKEDISRLDNTYSPYNQNTGYGQVNDNALARLDAIMDYQNKAKKLKIIGIVGGAILVGAGCTLIYFGDRTSDPGRKQYNLEIAGGCSAALGVALTSVCLVKSHNYNKKVQSLESFSLLKQDVSFKDGSSLALGVDLLRDYSMQTNTLGVGLRYNF